MAEEKNGEIQIDLGRIFAYIWHRIWIVIISLVLGAGIGFTVASVTKVDTYRADAIYVVYYSGSDITDALTYQTRISTVLGSCLTFVQQNRFARIVAEDMNEGGKYSLTQNDIFKTITYNYSAEGENTITITSVSTDPELTYDTLVAVTDIFSDYITENYRLAGDATLNFSLTNDIEMPTEPVKDNSVVVYTLVGGVGAALVCMLVLALIVVFDQRVKNEDDLVDKYGIAVLGSVPNFEDKDLNKREGY